MLRKYLPFFGFLLVALALFIWTENQFAHSFQACVGQEAAQQTADGSKDNRHIIAGIIEAQSVCSLRLVDAHSGLFAAIAAFVVAGFTFTLWRSTDKLWDAGERQLAHFEETAKRQLRAYMVVDGGGAAFTDEGRPTAQVKTQNVGQTPAYKVNVAMVVEFMHAAPESDITNTAPLDTARDMNLGPGVIKYVPVTAAKALSEIDINNLAVGNGHLVVYGYIGYDDAFGMSHRTRFCHLYSGVDTTAKAAKYNHLGNGAD